MGVLSRPIPPLRDVRRAYPTRRSRGAGNRRLLLAPLVRPDQLRLREHVTPDRLLELALGDRAPVAEHEVEGVELVDVTVAADGWTRAVPLRLAPVVPTHAAALRQIGARRDALAERPRVGRQV